MAWTIANEVNKAALDAITGLLANGSIVLRNNVPAELATVGLHATDPFDPASTATPSVASINSPTADSSVTAGTIVSAIFQTSGAAARLTGTVGTSGTDIVLTDNVIPSGATSVNFSSLTLSLAIS
jgi:hypothetical protein